ncbi:MAG: hypothetical protein JNL87_23000 [Burkholderiaceae bacterium]|nr:hypothetical protein [Burkholderiaceae bacterium]
MYVATLVLDDYGLLVRIEVRQRYSLLGETSEVVLACTEQSGQTFEVRDPLRHHDDVGPHAAALIVAIGALAFTGMSGSVALAHASPALAHDTMGHVLYAANVKHQITSLATSCSVH